MPLINVPGATALELVAVTADRLVIGGGGLLKGYSIRESAGGAGAAFTLRDGDSVSGAILGVVSLVAGESVRDWFGEEGILFERGVFVDMTAGEISGALYVIPEHMLTKRSIYVDEGGTVVFGRQ